MYMKLQRLCVLFFVLCDFDGRNNVLGKNLDTSYPVVFTGNATSYFGFNVALIEQGRDKIVLVAAIKANSTFLTGVINPGVLYYCSVDGTSCSEVYIDSKGNGASGGDADDEDLQYTELKDNMDLGMAMTAQPGPKGRIVVCAPRWRNKRYKTSHFMNGVCYVINRETQKSQDLRPLLQKHAQVETKKDPSTGKLRSRQLYSVGAAGFAATISPNNDLLLGAPGCGDFAGTLVKYRIPSSATAELGKPQIGTQDNTTALTAEQYMGYAIAAGRFFNPRTIEVAAGAPRDGEYHNGSVYLIELGEDNSSILKIKLKLAGEQMGSYYGATLLAIDIDRDGTSELLVGAPTYSLTSVIPRDDDLKKGNAIKYPGDEGKVYLYGSNGHELQLQGSVMGNSLPGARFGTAIANVGDLNMDGYQDIAIGAPYEDDHGAVYIYYGKGKSISRQYTQRIQASKFSRKQATPRGFGISISQGMDVDGNNYPDIVVGAYDSSHAVLLRSVPVVRTDAYIESDAISAETLSCQIDGKAIACFNITFCINYDGRYVTDQLDFIFTLAVDAMRVGPRAFLDGNNRSSVVKGRVLLQSGKYNCVLQTAYVHSGVQDVIAPLVITLAYDVEHRKGSSFCRDCPVIDEASRTVITNTTFFKLGCGDDNVCVADLVLKAELSGHMKGSPLIVGQDTAVTLHIEAKNQEGREKAYRSIVTVYLSPGIEVINTDYCEKNFTSLECALRNPLLPGEADHFRIKLNLASVTDMISINISARTDSEDFNPENNDVSIILPLVYRGDVGILGSPTVTQYIYRSTSTIQRVQHTYAVVKYYESPIDGVSASVAVPVKLLHEELPFLAIESVAVEDASAAKAGGRCNSTSTQSGSSGSKSNLVALSTMGSATAHHLRSYLPKSGKGHVKLDCTKAECHHFSCEMGPFTNIQREARIKIDMVINISRIIEQVGTPDTVDVVSSASVAIIDGDKYTKLVKPEPKTLEVITSFVKEGPPTSYALPWWAYLLIVLAGLSLLLILTYVLYKCGFFRRKVREELREEKRKTLVQGYGSPENSEDEDDDSSAR